MASIASPRRAPLALALGVAVAALACAAPARAQEQEKYTNLKVLPKDISQAELRGLMNSFTRALGVRCIYCHVGQEGKPFKHEDFALDDKANKLKARAMLTMVRDINEKYLASLDGRAAPAVKVECFTCHHGGQLPRRLQDQLMITYDEAGIDSTVALYHALRDRYYGRAVFDFGDVALADAAAKVQGEGHADDALRLVELNLEQNPTSNFAKRQHAAVAIAVAYDEKGAAEGGRVYQDLKGKYGDRIVDEELLINDAYSLLGAGRTEAAIALFQQITSDNPTSANAWDSLGEAYMKHADWKLSREAYKKSLALDPKNDNAVQKLKEIETLRRQKR